MMQSLVSLTECGSGCQCRRCEYTVTVTSTSDWTVSEGAAWVATEISTTKDKLVLKVNENLEKTDRSLTLTLTNAENLSQTSL